MPSLISFDSETWLIAPGLLAPPLVCIQWQVGKQPPQLRHRDAPDTLATVTRWLDGDDLLVGHNVAYDMGVLAAQWPHLIPKIFAKYDRDQITDTLLREQLIMISRGTFRSAPGADGELVGIKYSLDDCYARHFGRRLNKEGWRLFYRAFDDVPDTRLWAARAAVFQQGPLPDWAAAVKANDVAAMRASSPEEPERYALGDAISTTDLYESQERYFAAQGIFADQFRQARAAFALHLSSCWGLYTDADAVDKLEKELTEEFEALRFELQGEGLIRADGTANTAKAKQAMIDACREEGFPVIRTKGWAQKPKETDAEWRARTADPLEGVSLAAEACDRFDELSTIGQYSQFLTLRKTLSNDIKMLRAGCEFPVQPRYDMADTGRTRASKPNIQAINRGAGIREAFRPRPGTFFIQSDFEGLELHTLAAWCLEQIGWSRLADDLNAGKDVHCVMAAELLGESYEYVAGVKDGTIHVAPEEKKRIKEYRQRAKALNFGLPGGLGAKKFVRYAKASFNVVITETEAAQYKVRWLQRYPEMVEFFRLAAMATNNPAKLGDEEHIFTGRKRGNVRYSALCNGRFQGLGADAAKEALWRVTRACYVDASSPLYGCRVVAFVHDEIILEAPCARAAAAAKELGRLMRQGADVYLGKVPTRTEPLVMVIWSKSAEPVYANDGTLLPWAPEKAA